MKLAFVFRDANEKYATDYPATVGQHMTNTDSTPFMNIVPALSLRENERGMQIGAMWNPQYHQPTDRYIAYSDKDFRLDSTRRRRRSEQSRSSRGIESLKNRADPITRFTRLPDYPIGLAAVARVAAFRRVAKPSSRSLESRQRQQVWFGGPSGSWSGHGNGQTGSFSVETGAPSRPLGSARGRCLPTILPSSSGCTAPSADVRCRWSSTIGPGAATSPI